MKTVTTVTEYEYDAEGRISKETTTVTETDTTGSFPFVPKQDHPRRSPFAPDVLPCDSPLTSGGGLSVVAPGGPYQLMNNPNGYL